jgi:hypothetical protein
MARAFTQAGNVPGGGRTETITDALPVPLGPVQAKVNWVELASATDGSLPEVALVPDQPPPAVQEAAFVEVQLSVVNAPLATVSGFAASVTVGSAGVTVTVAVALPVPLGPVQERLKALVLVSAPVEALPDVARAPNHAPDALQDVAFVEDQLRVADPPLVTEVGFAEIDTVGTGGGGGVPVTLTWTASLALPCGPVQVSEKLLLVLSDPVDWIPEVALFPDQAPVAEHDTVFVELHVSTEAPPLATELGFATRDTDGSDEGGGGTVSAPAGDSLWAPQAASTRTIGISRRCLLCKVGPCSLSAARKRRWVESCGFLIFLTTSDMFLLSLTWEVNREDKCPAVAHAKSP